MRAGYDRSLGWIKQDRWGPEGRHMAQFRRVMELLKQEKVKGVLVFAGGVIPDENVKKLQKLGIKAVFGPGSSIASILVFLRKNL
jgi:methylmalonyl-CoA mutase, C-terminal domain